ncbi:MAG: PepSY-associated TM helix domain-containing protein, partial [Pseudomonadota bacterium]|nr:PepSY-associated TM helix domain-containing protein [Pseudomonadota bacterium]
MALTGAAMAYRVQLEAVVDPGLLTAAACGAPLPLDVLVAQARTASPRAGALKFARLYADPAATARIRFDDGVWVYVDRCSGRVVGKQVLYGGVFGTLGWLHIFGFAPNNDWVAGGVALLFALAMIAAGTVLWWPSTLRALRAGSRLAPGLRGRAFSLNLHKTIAVYAAPVLLASALTGLPQAFHWGQAPAPAPQIALDGARTDAVPLQQMLEKAQLLVPSPQRTQIRLSDAVATFEMVAPSAPHANALSYVHVAPYGGQVLGYVPHASNR